ncbi:MAG: S1-like domain-containing RNA-binding protein [Siphonobacter sp.]
MISLGKKNTLTALRMTSVGMFLGDGRDEVLLPNKYVPETLQEGETIEVFVYRDSEDRIIATTLQPYVELYEFAYLQVKAIAPFGAFLDWGLEKDLLVPLSEQYQPLQPGDWTIICLVTDDETDRLIGTCKVGQYLEYERVPFHTGEEVELLVYERSDLGYNAIINNHYKGLLYFNEVFQVLPLGSRIEGYIKQVRPDKNIDLSLQPTGYTQNIDQNTEKVLRALRANEGFLPLTDASAPELIYKQLEMSKKNFKKAIGALYRERVIRLEDNGVYLI